jgi:hypothetical protein
LAASERRPRTASPDEERARRLSGAEPEGNAQRVPLRIRQTLAELEDRRAELLQRRAVELHLPLDARSPNDAKVLTQLDRVLEQCGLADAGVSVHHEDGAVTVPRGTPAAARALRVRVACRRTAPTARWQRFLQHATRVRD